MAGEVELMNEYKLTGRITGSSKEKGGKNQYLILRANILQRGSSPKRAGEQVAGRRDRVCGILALPLGD